MTPSRELQAMLYAALTADAAVAALVGDRVYDAPRAEAVFPYLSFGPSNWFPEDADGLVMRREALQVDVWSRDGGRHGPCKEIVDSVAAVARNRGTLGLATHALATLSVLRTSVSDDPDGLTVHGFVIIEAVIEER